MLLVALLVGLACVACSVGSGSEKHANAALVGDSRPNVLIVTTDDLNEEVYENSPRLRSMLEPRGVTFENSYVTNSLCCPSRATMLRGQYDHNTRVLTNGGSLGGNRRFEEVGADNATVATRMQRAGYDTAFFGKYLNGKSSTYSPPGWGRYMQAGWFGTFVDHGRAYEYPEGAWRDDVAGNRAAKWLSGRGGAPFMAWVSFQAPHSEIVRTPKGARGAGYEPPERHLGTRDSAELAPKPSRPEADTSDKPAWVRRSEEGTGTGDVYRRQLEMMEGTADNLEKLTDALEAAGELDETYVVFTSDNGYMLGEHGLGPQKQAPYEESIGVPLVVAGPGIPEGRVRDELVLNNDISPTVLGWAGEAPHAFADGRSFAPLAEGKNVAWRERFLIHHTHSESVQFEGNASQPTYRGVVTDGWKYVRYATGEAELYDLSSDPYEIENLAGTMPGREKELGARIDALKKCAGSSCRAAEDAP